MFYLHVSRRTLAVGALLSVLCMQAAAAQDHAHVGASATISLDDIVEQIDARNPTLLAARLHAEALATVPDQVGAWPDPIVGLGYQPLPVLTARGTQRSQWSLEQTVPYLGRLSLRKELAAFDAEAAAYDGDTVREDLVLHAKEAYYELYRLDETERLLRDFEEKLAGYVEAAAVRYEVGQGPQQALLKAQLEKNQLAQQIHHIEAGRRRAAEVLARLTDHPDGPRHFLVAEPMLVRPNGFESAALADTALMRRPEFAALEAAAERSEREVELARMEAYPDVTLRVMYYDIARRDVPPTATGRDAVAVGVGVKIPLQRGRIAARTEQARLRREQIEAQRRALHTQVRSEIEELLAALDHEARAIDEFDDVLLPQAESTIEATLNAYASGTARFLDLLDAERTTFQIQTGYVDAVTRFLTYAARLERVLGVGTLSDVDAVAFGRSAPLPILREIE